MEVLLALLTAAGQLVPEVQTALPAAQSLISGQQPTSAQMVALWTAVQALEQQAAAKAAAIEAAAPAAA